MAQTAFRLGWNPFFGDPSQYPASVITTVDPILDADEEELQILGNIEWSDHGTHTIGTSSTLGCLHAF